MSRSGGDALLILDFQFPQSVSLCQWLAELAGTPSTTIRVCVAVFPQKL